MAVTGLVPGKQYEFRVYAENIYGRSEPSEPTSLVQTKAIVKQEFKKKEYPGKLTLPKCRLFLISLPPKPSRAKKLR